jgi:hypothetical protein
MCKNTLRVGGFSAKWYKFSAFWTVVQVIACNNRLFDPWIAYPDLLNPVLLRGFEE